MSKAQPWVKYEELEANYARFTVAPLKRGMGVTLGNSLRRVLLSSLQGHAITSVYIEGVEHEFSTMPNVVEDVLDVICNLKQIVFKGHLESPKEIKISFKGKGKITAKDIQVDSELEIITPDVHILELSETGSINMTLIVEKGQGYVPSEAVDKEGRPVNTIALDASYSPVIRVNHTVEDYRVGKELNYDSLTLEVWTNGSVTPEFAVKQASQILVDKFNLFQKLNEKPANKEVVDTKASSGTETKSILNLTIDDLELSARSSNCLKRAGIETVHELVGKDLSELTQIKNFGKKSADEINDKLRVYSLSLKGASE
jgi:DNA-directed RNA polymerase subunit alpha